MQNISISIKAKDKFSLMEAIKALKESLYEKIEGKTFDIGISRDHRKNFSVIIKTNFEDEFIYRTSANYTQLVKFLKGGKSIICKIEHLGDDMYVSAKVTNDKVYFNHSSINMYIDINNIEKIENFCHYHNLEWIMPQ